MIHNTVYLKINSSAFLKIEIPMLDNHLYAFDEIKIFLCEANKEPRLVFENSLFLAFEPLTNLLSQAIKKAAYLDSSLHEDIGYLWNQELHKANLIEHPESNYWSGENNLLWSADGIAVWLYNQNDIIVLEITPVYKWHFTEPEPTKPDYETYERFMKTYKPINRFELDNKTAQQWLKQVEHLMTIVQD
jgi:hypothetical protein